MKIEKIEIQNYRNLDGVDVHFDLNSNYIVGENNIGKSNFLMLINTISNAWSFNEFDFTDIDSPIRVRISLKLNEAEYGVFGDSFSPESESVINLIVSQNITDSHPQVINADTYETLRYKNLKKINFLKYDTNINPSNELKFDKSKGTGAFLGHLVQRNTSAEDIFLNHETIENLICNLNIHLKKIKAFDDFKISATVDNNSSELLSKLIYLIDENELSINNTGSGIQFMVMATLNIFSRILDLYKSKSTPFEESLYTTNEGQKILPLVMAIDEPEVHLHPYMQRSILNYYKRILKNKDSSFLELLKESFDIDGIDGQLIIVTHSTDALIDDYRNIVRFYRTCEGNTTAISGKDMVLDSNIKKHLLMHFQDIKEAFYSKCALIVEGETEYGCIHGFSESLNISLDDYGVCIVNAQGEKSIPKIKKLFEHFDIPSVVIFDSDVKTGKIPTDDEFFTNGICFEMDVIDKLIEMQKFDIIENIAVQLDEKANKEILDCDFVKKPFKKINYNLNSYVPKTLGDLDRQNIDEYRAVYFSWYFTKKGILIGRIIGNMLPLDCIPLCYKDAIYKAKEVVTYE